nr:MAG TPA: hypothetical protein [Caudoviricetes sp.]
MSIKGCELEIQIDGSVKAKTHPSLFNRAVDYYEGDVERAMELYGVSLTDEFKELGIENPTLQQLITFSNQLKRESPLTNQDIQSLIDITLSNKKEYEVQDKFVEAFTVEGNFGINEAQLRKSGIFTEEQILDFLDMEDVSSLQELYHKLTDYTGSVENIETPFKIVDENGNVINPDIVVGEFLKNYAGLTTKEEIMEKADQINDETVLSNPELIPAILEEVSNKTAAVTYVYDKNSKEVTKKAANDLKVSLEQSLDVTQDFGGLLDQLNFLINLPIEVYAYDLPAVQLYLESLENQMANYGINIKNISETASNKSYNDFQNFITSFYNFIYDVSSQDGKSVQETINDFVDVYNEYFEVEPEYVNTYITKNRVDGKPLVVENGHAAEDLLFAEKGVVNMRDDVYKKVKRNKTYDELLNVLHANPSLIPSEVFTTKVSEENKDINKKDIDSYLSAGIEDYVENSNIDIYKELRAYKLILGSETFNKKSNANVDTVMDIDIDPKKFTSIFVKETFFDPNLNKIFYIGPSGIESRIPIGEYTNRYLQNYLSLGMYNGLKQYAAISGNASLKGLIETPVESPTINDGVLRDFYANNLSELSEFTGEVTLKENALLTNLDNNDFIKFRGELYEKVRDGVYGKVELRNEDGYIQYNLSKPTVASSISQDNSIKDISESENVKPQVKRVKISKDDNIEFC